MKYITFKKRTGVLAVILSLLSLTACEKYLEIPAPTNSITTATVYDGKETIDKLMNNMYNNWANTSGIVLDYSRSAELFSDNAFNPTSAGFVPESTGKLDASPGQFSETLWNYCYVALYQANLLLEGLPTATVLDEPTRNAYIGAALTLRASSHYYLVRSFGDCPLILTTDATANSVVTRTPAAEVWKQVIKDLKDAMTLLPETGTDDKRYITNKYAPQALLARVYTTMGNWPEAEAAANAVINSGQYVLVSNLKDVFLRTSPEVISSMGNTWAYGPRYQNTALIGFYSTPAVQAYEASWPALSEDLLASFETSDNRKTSWAVLKNRGNYANPNNRYYCCKYKNFYDPEYAAGIPAGMEEDFVFSRLSEMYLIRAEAKAHQSDLGGAADDLNLIRNRAGLANTTAASQTDLVNAIIRERRVELMYEGGFRWDDLVRTGTADAVMKALPWKINWDSYKTVFPISTPQLNLNKNLKQTPGY
jgi:hypothetical protein